MNYSLGNMLGGGNGSLNPDKLSLNLQFATDKTLTARKGPTPTFTRASTATFVGSDGLIQSAAINAPRFDHDPITLACKGLLIEESRTNLLAYSKQLDNFYWEKDNLSVTANATTAPDGTVTGDKIIEDTANTYRLVGKELPLTSGQTYTQSYFVKADERTKVQIRRLTGNALPTPPTIIFDLSSGTYSGSVVSGWTNPFIENFGNGWYRIGISATPTLTSGDGMALYLCDAGGNISYLGDGTSGVYVWGAQLEVGAFPASYIPTVAASVVRSADVCSITGADFTGMYNEAEGTMLVNAFTPANGNRTIFAVDDNTANEMIRLRTEGTNPFFKVTDGGSELVAIDSGTVAANTTFKLAGAYKLNDFASSINGGAAVTDTSGTIPTVDRIRIGAGQSGNTMCGCISSLRYYKKRLSDLKLQTLTA